MHGKRNPDEPDVEGLNLEIDIRLSGMWTDLWSAFPELDDRSSTLIGLIMRAAYALGYQDADGDWSWAEPYGCAA